MKLGTFEVDIQNDAVDKQHDGGSGVLRPSRICYLTIISTTFWALVFFLRSPMQGGDGMASVLFKPSTFSIPLFSSVTAVPGPPPKAPPASAMVPATGKENRSVTAALDDARCAGRYIYMYDLPSRFNDDLVVDCRKLDLWMDMCTYVANCGMGQALGDEGGAFSDHGWYATNQFMLDVVFHGRMMGYECLTDDPAIASAVFVPFYASLDGGRYMWNSTSMRDALALDLVEWLARRPEWRAMAGRDHFLVAGRTAVEFSRNGNKGWGTNLLHHSAVQNMTVLVLETVSWTQNNIAVPYPTYFHPETAADVVAWQSKVRKAERQWLFSFAGAPRPGSSQTVRAEIIQQCGESSRCSLYRCGAGADCNSPGGVMRLMESSTFCLEPRGDSLTRRATFDAILAGCIPVFFHPGSAYTQYTRHLPHDPSKYSVLIMHTDVTGRNVSIEETLSKIPPETVKAMRDEVIRLIPRVVYADPRSRRVDFKDAFDVAVEAVIDRAASRRRGASFPGREHKETPS